MKRVYLCMLCMMLALLLLLSSCTTPPTDTPSDPSADGESTDTPADPTPDPEPEPEPEPERTDFRVLLTSDIHCTHLLEWYGVPYRDRMQHWVDSVIAEHEETPIDLLVIMGDVSLDHWQHSGGGSWINEGHSSADEFYMDFVMQLPHDIPVVMIAGNHEQYSYEQWEEIVGHERQEYYVLGENLFLMVDTFRGELDPDYHHDGKYVGVDMDFVNEVLEEHGDKDIWLIGHYFDMSKESEEFKTLLRENTNVKGLFQGHTHQTSVIQLGEEYNDLTIAQTGNFAYTKEADIVGSFWGFRDLTITAESAECGYIIVDSEAIINGKETTIERNVINVVEYEK